MSTEELRKREFKERVYVWSRKLEVDVQSLTVDVRPMTRKWASSSTAGRLSFSSDVLDLGDDLQAYVIVHELLHLFVPNHSKLWKALMRVHLGNWEALASRLRIEETKVRSNASGGDSEEAPPGTTRSRH